MENLFKRTAEDLISSKYAIALTGLGISTESRIPDFWERKGRETSHIIVHVEGSLNMMGFFGGINSN